MRNTKSGKKLVLRIFLYLAVIIICLITLYPYFVTICTALKSRAEIFAASGTVFPVHPIWSNLTDVWSKAPMGSYMLNSVLIAGGSTLLAMLCGIPAAYALSRLHFKGRTVLLMVILGVSMFPTIATLSPLYLILKNMNLLNTYRGLILTYIGFSLPMAIWLMTNFFSQIERGFEEAAAIDGCSYFQTFTKIMLPLIKPATFSVGLLVFINCWNEYLYSLTFMSKDNMRTVPVGIALFPSNYQLHGETWQQLLLSAHYR